MSKRPADALGILRYVVQIYPPQVEECTDGSWRKRKGFAEVRLGGAAISPLRLDDAKKIVKTRIRGELFDRPIQLASRCLQIPLLNHFLEPLKEFARRAVGTGMRKTDQPRARLYKSCTSATPKVGLPSSYRQN